MQQLDPTTEKSLADVCGRIPPATSAFACLLVLWRRRRHRRAAIKELQALPDRLLRDAGISRSDIPRVAEAAARKSEPLD